MPSQSANPMICARCETGIDYVGTKRFHEGTRWGVLGDIGELFVNKEKFEGTVGDMVARLAAKMGENISVQRVSRIAVGENA